MKTGNFITKLHVHDPGTKIYVQLFSLNNIERWIKVLFLHENATEFKYFFVTGKFVSNCTFTSTKLKNFYIDRTNIVLNLKQFRKKIYIRRTASNASFFGGLQIMSIPHMCYFVQLILEKKIFDFNIAIPQTIYKS